jgi:shikimate dehydrogenase
MELFGIIGKPVLHSRSPALHNAAFAALGIDARYLRIAADDAIGALQTASALGLRGLNVTAPYKEAAAHLACERSAAVSRLGAANTLLWRGEGWRAHNTDVYGVRAALAQSGVGLGGANALVLGSGGAARAAAAALGGAGANVSVAARDPQRARAVASLGGGTGCSLADAGAIARRAQVIVSAVSTGELLLEPGCLEPGTVVLDGWYQSESALVRGARLRGCIIVDGSAWLLHQAAEAYKLFTGRTAPLEAMEQALQEEPPRRGAMLALVGFMGAGKSTVARRLGEQLGLYVFDTDDLVEERAGMPAAAFLREKGESALRHVEQEVIEALPDAPAVVCCGGGLVTRGPAARILREKSGFAAWLWASPETCLARISDVSSRPLLGATPETSAARLLGQRMGSYAGACDVVVDTEYKTAGEVADAVAGLWGERP